MSAAEAIDTRFRHDFEYWAARCATIRDKLSGADVRLRLNAGQRKVLAALEKQRRAGRPMRIIILKARQWGSSTFVQVYMAWIQIIHRRNWNSLICAHVKDTAITIRRIYSRRLSRRTVARGKRGGVQRRGRLAEQPSDCRTRRHGDRRQQ